MSPGAVALCLLLLRFYGRPLFLACICRPQTSVLPHTLCLSLLHSSRSKMHAACCSEPETDRAKTERDARRTHKALSKLQDHSYTRLRPYHSLHEKQGSSAPPIHLHQFISCHVISVSRRHKHGARAKEGGAGRKESADAPWHNVSKEPMANWNPPFLSSFLFGPARHLPGSAWYDAAQRVMQPSDCRRRPRHIWTHEPESSWWWWPSPGLAGKRRLIIINGRKRPGIARRYWRTACWSPMCHCNYRFVDALFLFYNIILASGLKTCDNLLAPYSVVARRWRVSLT